MYQFASAVRVAVAGDVARARTLIVDPRERHAREWFDEHAQIAFKHRRAFVGVDHPRMAERMPRASTPQRLRERVWERDGYRCRYCNLPTIPDAVRKEVQRVIGEDLVPYGYTNASKHGIVFVARSEYDHVHPAALGGSDDEQNLVTACAGCNYGKDRFTLQELDLEDPRSRPPSKGSWDGLTSLLAELRQMPAYKAP